MSIVSAGQIIKDARLRANMTQEKLSEGICSTVALSKIENGKLGVSPSTFALLMEKTGSPREALPTFKNIDDYNCFQLVKGAYKDVIHHQLDNAYSKILDIISMNYADNKYYLQQTMLLYCWLQYSACHYDRDELTGIINNALGITKPDFDLSNLQDEAFSYMEYKGIYLLINILIDYKEFDYAGTLLSEIDTIIKKVPSKNINQYTRETEYIHCLTYGKCLYFSGDYSNAQMWLNSAMDIYYSENINSFIAYELFIMKEMTDLKAAGADKISDKLEYYIAAACLKHCAFIPNLKEHIKNNFPKSRSLDEYTVADAVYEKLEFPNQELSDGLYNIYDKDVITIGKLVKHLRNEQNIPMDKLCFGICSKSMLSKIENNALTPSIYVIEALLGRLGISEEVFTFYGNDEESKYYELRSKVIVAGRAKDPQLFEASINTFIDFAKSINNKLVLQQAYGFKSQLAANKDAAYELLDEAIKLTYPDFSLEKVNDYILSWTEYNILNGLLKCIYHSPDKQYTNSIFHRLLSNTDKPPLVNKLFSNLHAASICLFLIFLNVNEMFNETLIFIDSISDQLNYYDPYNLNFALYYYSLAKAQLNHVDSLSFYSKASLGNTLICNDTKIIEGFKKDIYELTNIVV